MASKESGQEESLSSSAWHKAGNVTRAGAGKKVWLYKQKNLTGHPLHLPLGHCLLSLVYFQKPESSRALWDVRGCLTFSAGLLLVIYKPPMSEISRAEGASSPYPSHQAFPKCFANGWEDLCTTCTQDQQTNVANSLLMICMPDRAFTTCPD